MCMSNLTDMEAVERGKTDLPWTFIFLWSNICLPEKCCDLSFSLNGPFHFRCLCLPVSLLSCDLKIFDTFSLYVILDTLFWLSWNILEHPHRWYFLQYVALNDLKGVQLTKYHSMSCLIAAIAASFLFFLIQVLPYYILLHLVFLSVIFVQC